MFFLRSKSRAARRRNVRLLIEHLEERSLLAQVGYQVHLLPPDGSIAGPELTSVSVGQAYDLAVSVRDVRGNPGALPGVFAAYVDLGYDSSKTRVQVAEVQRIRIGPFDAANPASSASGSFTLLANGHTTWPIAFNGDVNALASATELAIGALTGIGLGNVSVKADVITGDNEIVLQVKFLNRLYDQNVANLNIGSQSLQGPTNPQVSLTYEGDLGSGSAFAFQEAFRSRVGEPAYVNGLFANNQPNLLDDVGAFASIFPTGTGVKELVRARMVATAAGSVTFTPQVVSLLSGHETLLFDPMRPVPAAEIDLGTPKTLTIATAPIVARPDFHGTLTNYFMPIVIDVLANDITTPPTEQIKEIVAVSQAAHGTTAVYGKIIHYTPAAGFTGTDTFTYTARNTTAGGTSQTSTGTVTVTVVAPTMFLMRYQVRLVRPGGALYERDPQNPAWLVSTGDLTTLDVGEEYDMVVTVQPTSKTPQGVFSAYTDVTFDESKTRLSAESVEEAFRPKGVSTIAGIVDASVFFEHGRSAATLPGRIDDVGGFTSMGILPTTMLTGPEMAAGISIPPPREVARGRFKATAAGTVTFAPDLSAIRHPHHDSGLVGISGAIDAALISTGTPKTLTIVAVVPYQASADNASTLEDSAGVIIEVLGNDTSPAPSTSKQIVSFTQPANGAVTQVGDTLRYVPAGNSSGTETFTYTAKGNATGAGLEGTATVTVTVSPVNDAPTLDAIADLPPLLEDAALQTIVLAGITTGGESQNVTFTAESSNPELTGPLSIDYQSPAGEGRLSFEPAPNSWGGATVTITVKDSGGTADGGVDSISRSFTLVVKPVNDSPSFVPGENQEATDESGPQAALRWATDFSAGPGEDDQTAGFHVVADNELLFAVQPQIDATGTLTYTPALNAEGTAIVSAELIDDGPSDDGEENSSAAITFTIRIVKMHPMHNAALPLDATGDLSITAKDALHCINYLNAFGIRRVSEIQAEGESVVEASEGYLDVNADGRLTAADPLAIINRLNAFGPLINDDSLGEGEGSGLPSADLTTVLALMATDTAEVGSRKRR